MYQKPYHNKYLFVLTTKPFYLARYPKLRDNLDAKIKDQPNIVEIEEEEDRLGQAVEKNSVERLNIMLCPRPHSVLESVKQDKTGQRDTLHWLTSPALAAARRTVAWSRSRGGASGGRCARALHRRPVAAAMRVTRCKCARVGVRSSCHTTRTESPGKR